MFFGINQRNYFGIIFLILFTTFLVSCSSDDSAASSDVKINIKGIWSAYWYDDVATVDHLIVDENSASGNIKGRWYDAEDNTYYVVSGAINDRDVDINVQYPFSWDLKAILNMGDNIISGEVTISGTGSVLDDVHTLRLEKVN